MIEEFKKKKKVNDLYSNIVKLFKDEYHQKIKNLGKKERERMEKLQKNCIYAHIKGVLLTLCLLLLVSLFLCVHKEIEYTGIISLLLALLALGVFWWYARKKQGVMADKRREERYEAWRHALNTGLNQSGYSTETYIRYLLVYHRNSGLQRILIMTISIGYTIAFVVAAKDLLIYDFKSTICICLINLIVNFLGNKVAEVCSDDWYFESIKNDFILR